MAIYDKVIKDLHVHFYNRDMNGKKLETYAYFLEKHKMSQKGIDDFYIYWLENEEYFPKIKQILGWLNKREDKTVEQTCRFLLCNGGGYLLFEEPYMGDYKEIIYTCYCKSNNIPPSTELSIIKSRLNEKRPDTSISFSLNGFWNKKHHSDYELLMSKKTENIN